MRLVLPLVVVLVIATTVSAQIPASTTLTGSASKGSNNLYTFTPPSFGQVIATLSWDVPSAHLLMVMACGSGSDRQSFGIAAGLLDRFARFEAGVIGGDPCTIAVTSADETANFRLNVTRSGDQFLSPSSFGRGAETIMEARPGTLIGDEAIRVLEHVKGLIR